MLSDDSATDGLGPLVSPAPRVKFPRERSHTITSVRVVVSALVLYLGWSSIPASALELPQKKYSPIERMAPARLKATHESVAQIQRSRRELPAVPGLNDYRAILHAHAEDSAHTGGTRPEMLADARKVGVRAILLSNHFRPPTDFITDSWRGLHDGVLFIPGSEDRGFLLLPTRSIVAHMKDPLPSFIETVGADGGLIFLSHIEERPDHPMAGLNGMEIYNRHADAKKDSAGLLAIASNSLTPRRSRNWKKTCDFTRTSCSPRRWNTRPTISPSGTPKPKLAGSRASPPMIAIIIRSCSSRCLIPRPS